MRLPVSGLDATFRLPDGHDDLAILEAHGAASINASHRFDIGFDGEAKAAVIEGCLCVLRRLVALKLPTSTAVSLHEDQAPQADPWVGLTITDFESALLGLRRFLFGDMVRCTVRCVCEERMEIEFPIADLLREAQPRTPSRVERSPTRSGWFELLARHDGEPMRPSFRLPTVADQLLALRSPDPYRLLGQRCIESASHNGRATASIERAMESMSPVISRPTTGACAACGVNLNSQLHVPSLVLGELRASCAGVHREIHAIAATYHWDELTILAMPQLRRQAYNDAISQAGAR